MTTKRHWQAIVPTLTLFTLSLAVPAWADGFPGGVHEALGPRLEAAPHHHTAPRHPPRPGSGTMARLRHWNEVAIDMSGLDYTPVAPGENRVFGEQFGPTRASRAMASVHLAIFEAVNAIAGGYQSYLGLPPAPHSASMDAAIAQAAHDTLVALFPSQQASCDAQLAADLSQISDGQAKAKGIALGQRAAAAILTRRATDGAQRPDPFIGVEFFTGEEPGEWRQDPISQSPLALGAYWGDVKPFVLKSAHQFRVPPPPPSRQYGVCDCV